MSDEPVIVLLHSALAQLLHEVLEAGFEEAKDYNWPKAIADARHALAQAKLVYGFDGSRPARLAQAGPR